MIPCKDIINEALNEVSIALAQMLKVAQMSFGFTVGSISPGQIKVVVTVIDIFIIFVLVVKP